MHRIKFPKIGNQRRIFILLSSLALFLLSGVIFVDINGYKADGNPDTVSIQNWELTPRGTTDQPVETRNRTYSINRDVPGAHIYKIDSTAGSPTVGQTFWTVVKQGHFDDNNFGGKGYHTFRWSAWTDRPENGGTLVYQDTDYKTVYFDHAYNNLTYSYNITEPETGEFVITAIPSNVELGKKTIAYYWEFHGAPTVDTQGKIVRGAPITDHFETTTPQLKLSLSKPGIIGIKVNTNGGALYPGLSTNNLVYCYIIQSAESGSILTLPAEVTDYTYVAQNRIPGDMRLSFDKESISIFSGGLLNLRPNALGSNNNPQYVEIDLPNNVTLAANATILYAISEITGSNGNKIPDGYHRLRLIKRNGQQNWMPGSNENILIYPIFTSDQIIGQSNLKMRLRIFNASEEDRTDKWQDVNIKCVAIPNIQLPKRLSTSFTWTSVSKLFANNATYPDTDFYSMYKKLGYNNVPFVGAAGDPNSSKFDAYTPAARAADSKWQDYTFGPEHSTLYNNPGGMGYFEATNLATVNTVLHQNLTDADIDSYVDNMDFNTTLNFSLSADQILIEKTKWKNSLHFNATTGYIDMAYDGVFLTRDFDYFGQFLDRIKPEYVYIDSEGFTVYANWMAKVRQSANAALRKNNDEIWDETGYRMLDEMMAHFNQEVKDHSPTTKLVMYDSSALNYGGHYGFPLPILIKNHIVLSPSLYNETRMPDKISAIMRGNRATLAKGYELIPWLTPGAYGEIESTQLFDATIHTFLNGATGIAMFRDAQLDDMDDMLQQAEAIGLISPYEDMVMDGDVAFNDISNISNATVSAMKQNGKYLLAVTPKDKAKPVSFNINTGFNTNYTLTDLRHGGIATVNSATVNFTGVLSESTVMRLVGTADIGGLTPTPTPIRTFTYKSKTTISGTKTDQVIKVLVNNTEANINGNTWTLDLDLPIGQNTITIIGQDQNSNAATTSITITRRKPADANADGNINIRDLSSLMLNWGKVENSNPADFNEDGKVGILDFSALMLNWGK